MNLSPIKTTKYGKIQQKILKYLLQVETASFLELFKLVFPNREYTSSYLTPILMRMQYTGLLQVVNRNDIRVNPARFKFIKKIVSIEPEKERTVSNEQQTEGK